MSQKRMFLCKHLPLSDIQEAWASPLRPLGNQSRRILLEGNPYSGFPSNDRFALCLLSKEHLAMNSWEDAPWRGGRAGGYCRRPLEGDPAKGSSSKSVRVPPPLWGALGRCPCLLDITYFKASAIGLQRPYFPANFFRSFSRGSVFRISFFASQARRAIPTPKRIMARPWA